jgi:hypothetical protein
MEIMVVTGEYSELQVTLRIGNSVCTLHTYENMKKCLRLGSNG